LDYLAQPGFYQANTYKVAYRKQNDSPYWTEFNGFLSPSYSSSPNRVHREEYVLVGEPPCTGPSQLPAIYTDCDSVVISLPATFNNPQWSDGSTASNRTFYQNGSFIITGTDDNGCLISDTVAIQVNTAGFSPIPDQDFCDSITINLDPNLQAVQWFDGSLNRQRQFFTAGTYWYRAQDPLNGCAFRDTFELSLSSDGVVWNEVFADLDVFCLGDTIKLFPPQGTQVVWPNSSDSSFTVYGPSTITVDLSAGCSDTTLSIDVDFTDCDCRVHIPNAFTPNGDGLNEKFRPQSACEFLSYHLIIFNRWGIKVFETTDPQQAFDGTYRGQPVPQSSLVYQLTYTSARTQRSVQGIVNLLR
jgi:gliding motility-associated-like protein